MGSLFLEREREREREREKKKKKKNKKKKTVTLLRNISYIGKDYSIEVCRNILHSHQEITNKSSNIMNSRITLSPNMWETESSKSIRYRLALVVFTNKTILRKFWFNFIWNIKSYKKIVTFWLKCKLHPLSLTEIHFSSLTLLSSIELSKFQIYSM